ncbi:hypothetical protein H2200_000864 [Cladophialophora chaetospira]|uniref:Xylanolytic transcriptional activator regulatory domain-containing protein n=1 Tax=Cladophialophora chaetospira TaxID=386627 RepID=A0AA38XP77_9EURO|nr:hypothetical protein H2200_000864 [Cladophialophora chaetospira]
MFAYHAQAAVVSPERPVAHGLHDRARDEQFPADADTRVTTIAQQEPICTTVDITELRSPWSFFDTPPDPPQTNSVIEGHNNLGNRHAQSLEPDPDLTPSSTAIQAELRTASSSDVSNAAVSGSGDNGWFIPDEVACELIALFFDIIRHWIPLLHGPQFYEKYVKTEARRPRLLKRQSVKDHDAFMINCMFALAARFSRSRFFADTDPLARGQAFAERAAAIKDLILKVVEEPSLEFVKGCVMLAFYDLTAGHAAPAALLTSVCVRFAYDLGLDAIDDDCELSEDGSSHDHATEDVETWVHKEELRRLWWSIYELDCAVSTFSQQPYGIERGTMKVFLPVSDHHWFDQLPLRSSHLIQSASETWKSLQGCKNQSPRAWYLVTNYLKSCLADAARHSKQHTPEKLTALEHALACHKLALPATFQLRSLSIEDKSFGDSNWIISTNFMLLSCDTLMERIKWSIETPGPPFGAVSNAALFGKHFYSTLVRISQVWPPEYIPLNNPLISCCVINPWDTLLELRQPPAFQSYELAKLLLGHYSRFWMIGNALLRLITLIYEGHDASTYPSGSKDRDMLRRFSVLCPSSSSKKRRCIISRLNIDARSADNRPPAETLPSPDLTNLDCPEDFQWFPVLWDSLQDFTFDFVGSDMLPNPSDGVSADHVKGASDTIALPQLNLSGKLPHSNTFDPQFATL